MLANEMLDSNFYKGLWYGPSGTTKTCTAASMPGPIEYWDFDGKFTSAVHWLKQRDPEKLREIDVYQFNKLPVIERIPAWEKRSRMIDQLIKEGKDLPFHTLVLDSLTTFSHYILEDYLFRSQKAIKRAFPDIPSQQDYGLLDKHLTRIISGLLSLDCHVVMIGHSLVEKDETTGAIERKPLMAGKFADKVSIYFEEVYACKNVGGKRLWHTTPEGGYIARTQRGLPKETTMDIQEIFPK